MALPMPPSDYSEPRAHNGYYPTQDFSPVLTPKPFRQWRKLLFHVALFLATLGTSTFFYTVLDGADPFTNPSSLLNGLPFSLPLMGILLSHEMGHYLLARKQHCRISSPASQPLARSFECSRCHRIVACYSTSAPQARGRVWQRRFPPLSSGSHSLRCSP